MKLIASNGFTVIYLGCLAAVLLSSSVISGLMSATSVLRIKALNSAYLLQRASAQKTGDE